ncbi:MAG: hypothetical protein M1815_001205 [Lichina confinis]|nr:MAG: hypothetical protein M1815_001205 [Lichina confinis]
MDIREAGRWGIGAEVLLRQDQTEMTDDDEGQRRGRQGRTNNDGEDTYSDAYEDEEHTGGDGHDDRDDDWRGQKKQSKTPPSTTRQDFDSAGEYYERLILQYSSQQATHFSNKANAMDFALAMFGLWIHHSTQHRRTLSSVADAGADAGEEEEEEEEEEEDADETHEIRQSRYGFRGESHYDSHDKNPENRLDEPSSRYRHSNSKSRRSSAQARTSARNNDQSARQQMAELRDAKEIEARMHKMMLSPPYCDSAEMSRLRSMIALWIDHLREMVSGEQEVVEMEVEVEGQEGEGEAEAEVEREREEEEEEEREVKEEEEDEIWG